MSTDSTRVPIRFDAWYRVLSSVVLLSPSDSFIELSSDAVTVRMAWGFRTRFPTACVVRAARYDNAPISRGVHGFAGRWLVNGSVDRILAIDVEPHQRAWVMGVPVKLRQLLVSVDDPEGVAARLNSRKSRLS